jgi:hypothetical protein
MGIRQSFAKANSCPDGDYLDTITTYSGGSAWTPDPKTPSKLIPSLGAVRYTCNGGKEWTDGTVLNQPGVQQYGISCKDRGGIKSVVYYNGEYGNATDIAYLVKKLTCGDGTVLNHQGKTISSGNSSNNASLNCTNDNSCQIVGCDGTNDLLSGLDVSGVDPKIDQSYQDVLQPMCYSPPQPVVNLLPPLPSTAATDPSGGTPINTGISGGYILLFLVVIIFSGLFYKSRSAKPSVVQYPPMQQPVMYQPMPPVQSV